MKKTRKLLFIAICSVALVMAASAVAQTNVVAPHAVATNAPVNSTAGGAPAAPTDLAATWNLLIVALVPLVVAGIKKVLPKIPKALLPVGATLLGVLANFLAAKAGLLSNNSWQLGALCGAAGVGLREILDQIKSLFSGPPVTPPPAAPPGGPSGAPATA